RSPSAAGSPSSSSTSSARRSRRPGTGAPPPSTARPPTPDSLRAGRRAPYTRAHDIAVGRSGPRPPARVSVDTADLAERILAGDRRALARAITLVESTRGDRRAAAAALLDAVLPATGDAVRVGITGTPGA